MSRCIEACVDGEKGYALAAADAHDTQLKAVLHHYAAERADFVQRLQGALGRLGVTTDAHGSGAGLVHRTWMEAKALGRPDDHALLVACERGERAALAAYDHLFETIPSQELPADLRAVLLDQRAAIQSAHDDVARR